MIGQTLGSYTLRRELGRGGMGVVYEGVHGLLGRSAAIKVLLPGMSRREEVVQRFFTEARAASAIKHPGIIEIYDFGFAPDGAAFIVMELLTGEALSARLKRGRVAPSFALAVARQIAAALAVAHAAGIVHRDLKPDNVFLVPDAEVALGERVKLLDFGIAKLLDQSDVVGDAPTGAVVTTTGAVMGTPYYMSPEQCRGAGAIDERADLYALGCILFEALCGRVPFLGAGAGEIIGAHLHVAPPAPRSLVPALAPEIEALVLRLLAKSPAARPASALAVAEELASLTKGASDRPASTDPMGATLLSTTGSGPVATATTLGASVGARATAPTRPTRRAALVAAAGVVSISGGAAVLLARRDGGGGRTAPDAAVVAAITDAALPADAEPDAAVLYDRVYLELGKLRGETAAADRLLPGVREAITEVLRSDPYIVTAWPGGGVPDAEALRAAGAHGFALDATLIMVTIRDPQKPGVRCEVRGVVASFPSKEILGTATGAASVEITTLDEATVQDAGQECFAAAIATVVTRHVLPLVRQRALTAGHADEVSYLMKVADGAARQRDWPEAARLARAVLAVDPDHTAARALKHLAEGELDAGPR